MATTERDMKNGIHRDLLPIKLFCQYYDFKAATIYSWKNRHPYIMEKVIFNPPGLEMHISISGYEQWIRGEITKNNTQQASNPTAKTSRSNSSGLSIVKNTSTKHSHGAVPQLT